MKKKRDGLEIKQKTQISVIIPIYNVAKYLPQCLESVLHQTYTDLDILLIDDGSTDECSEICDSVKDERVRVIHTENNGLATARKIGLRNIKGQVISFLDSDDWMEENTIEIMVETMMRTGADIVKASSCTELPGKTIYGKSGTERIYRGKEILQEYRKFSDVVWNKLYKIECFDGIEFPDGQNYEDVSTTWRILKKLSEKDGVAVIIPNELFHFRLRKSSITNTKTFKNISDAWKAFREKYEAVGDLSGCYSTIGTAWANYCGLPEKEKAKDLINEMYIFSKKHRRQIVDKGIPLCVCCLISQSKSHVLMWMIYHANKGRKLFYIWKKMFD